MYSSIDREYELNEYLIKKEQWRRICGRERLLTAVVLRMRPTLCSGGGGHDDVKAEVKNEKGGILLSCCTE